MRWEAAEAGAEGEGGDGGSVPWVCGEAASGGGGSVSAVEAGGGEAEAEGVVTKTARWAKGMRGATPNELTGEYPKRLRFPRDMRFRCARGCGKEFPRTIWDRQMRVIHCPNCGASEAVLVSNGRPL